MARPPARAVVVGLAGLVATGLVLGAVGCGSSTPMLDSAATAEAVGDAVVAKIAVDAPDADAGETTCPDEIELEVDATFECRVDLGELGTVPVRVRIVDEDGALDVAAQASVVDPRDAADQLKVALRQEFDRDFEVTCGDDPPQVRAEGDRFICRANDDTTRRSVAVTVTDAAGSLSFDVGDGAGQTELEPEGSGDGAASFELDVETSDGQTEGGGDIGGGGGG